MGFVRKHTGLDLTGGGARRAAEQAAREQEGFTREGLAALRGDLAPFRDVGIEAANELMGGLFSPQMMSAQDVINNPFFQALSGEQDRNLLQQRAALGLAGSGGTQDSLTRNMLLLGNQFQQQDYENQLQNNQLRFNQLLGIAGMGQNAAAQTGVSGLNALTSIGGIRSNPLAVGAQVAANQGQQFMNLLGLGSFGPKGGGGMMGGGGLDFSNIANIGSLFGGPATATTTMSGGLSGLGAGGMGMFSDRRMKRDIEKVGEDEYGNIYRFKYTWSDDVYEGRMAQELMQVRPDAVMENNGYLMVSHEFAARRVG